MRNIQNFEEEKFYLTDERDFTRVYDIISKMPNFVLYETKEEKYQDYFYDTKDEFLKKNRATVRVRKEKDRQTLSIKYTSSNALMEEKVREAYFDLPVELDLLNCRDAMLFLSNKINDIYAQRLDIDVVRVLRDLRVYLVIHTNRTIYRLKNNKDLKINVKFDSCLYQTKFNNGKDEIVKFEMENYPDTLNTKIFEDFIDNVNRKVYFVHDNESKFMAGSRILKYDRFNTKLVEEEETEENKEEENKK